MSELYYDEYEPNWDDREDLRDWLDEEQDRLVNKIIRFIESESSNYTDLARKIRDNFLTRKY